jgi:hypothetical protein
MMRRRPISRVSFYEKNLTDDWSDGLSNGQFQTKKELISDLTDKTHNITFHETLANMKARVYSDTAVANDTETYDALTSGKRVAKTIIPTDTLVKVAGQWKLAASHRSFLQPKCSFQNTCGNRKTFCAADCFLDTPNVIRNLEFLSTRLIAAIRFAGDAWSGEMTTPTCLSAILAATPGSPMESTMPGLQCQNAGDATSGCDRSTQDFPQALIFPMNQGRLGAASSRTYLLEKV